MTIIHDSRFDIQDDAGTRHEDGVHYRVHPDVYRYIAKLVAVVKDARKATEDWYFDDSHKDLCRSLDSLEAP